MFNSKDISVSLNSLADEKQAAILQRFFKTGPGEYGEGDIFLGITVPVQREVAKKYQSVPLSVVSQLLKSKIHEYRLVGLLILIKKYEAADNQLLKQEIFDFYVNNFTAINNWDLVDLSAPKIVGDFLFNYRRDQKQSALKFLLKLADSKNLWERRIAMISTFYFIYQGQTQETFIVATKLLDDKHDLIHKAVGWMLREAGKRVSREKLVKFLNTHQKNMPRTTLRYAIERLPEAARRAYLAKE
ncbi:MAG TPA: DNA alkylation repair protein [Candidatus Saccharimonadales bacterium]|nr:DNA alkylation repair protein [Candidatus Saccharimonadales bacterium]